MKIGEQARRDLHTIRVQHRQWLADMTKFIASNGENAPSNFDLAGATSKHASKNLLKAERALEERLRALVCDMERTLEALLGQESPAQMFIRNLQLAAHKARVAAGAKTPPKPAKGAPAAGQATTASNAKDIENHSDLSLLLFVDPTLQELPWEAMEFAEGFDGQVARDFSLHLYHHRLLTLYGSPLLPPGAATDKEALSAAQETATAQAQGGLAPISLSPASVRYLVDPLGEDSGSRMEGYARPSLTEQMQRLLKDPEVMSPTASMAQWQQLRSENGLVSLQDFLCVMDASTQRLHSTVMKRKVEDRISVVAYLLGRLGSLLPPIEIASMNLEQVSLLCCVDMSNNDASNRRQISADVLKKTRHVGAEMPVQMAALLSLSGAGALLTSQWSTPINAQNRFLEAFMRYFTNSATDFPAAPLGSKHTLLTAVALASYPLGSKSSSSSDLAGRGGGAKGGAGTGAATASGTNTAAGAAAAAILNGDTMGAAADGSGGGGGAEGVAAAPKAIKKWIRLSRVVYGAHHITYN